MRVIGIALAALTAAPAFAQVNLREPDPAVWLRQVYAAYEKSQKTHDDSLAGVDLVERRASRALAALFKRDEACSSQSNEICALDWDFVVDGQDFELSKIKVGPTQATGDKATVTVSFTNMQTPCVNLYSFVREDGVWKVDEIETHAKGEKPARIGDMLRAYKY